MDSRDRDAISDLFDKLRDVERQAGPRDADAERFIADEARRLPGAPYYMAQTIIMQDMALNAKQQEIDDLKRRVDQGAGGHGQATGNGGFLSRVFGGGSAGDRQAPRGGESRSGPWGSASQSYAPPQQYAQPQYAPQAPSGFGRGGGFLAGAAQTAMGVAGGVVLGNALGNMFGGNGFGFGGGEQPPGVQETANASEEPQNADAQNAADDPADDAGYQDASYDDGGFADDGMDEI